MNLRDAIEQQMNLGHRDPVEIANHVLRLYGEDEVRSWLDVRRLVYQEAVQQVAADRRVGEQQARRESEASGQVAAMHGKKIWVEGKGHVLAEDLTAEDCMVVAEYHRKLAGSHEAAAYLYEHFAAAIRAAGVTVLGEVPEHLRLELAVAA